MAQIIQGKTGCENHPTAFCIGNLTWGRFPMYFECLVISLKTTTFCRFHSCVYTVDAPSADFLWSIIIPSPDPQLSVQPRKLSQTPIIASVPPVATCQGRSGRIIGPFCIWPPRPSSSPKLALKRPSLSKEGRIRGQYCATQWKVGLFLPAIISNRT